jgi:hypothetical protein
MGLFAYQVRTDRRDASRPAGAADRGPELATGRHDPLGADRTLRVIETRFADEELLLVVELM